MSESNWIKIDKNCILNNLYLISNPKPKYSFGTVNSENKYSLMDFVFKLEFNEF